MKKFCYLFLLIIYCKCLYAQQGNYFQYTIEKHKDGSSFPIFYNSKDSLICEKINLYLQLSKLSLLKGKEQKHIFEQVVSERIHIITIPRLFFNFSMLNNTSKMLSIMFHESSCGITCWYWKKYYNFNLSNGSLLSLSDLFDTVNFKKFLKLTINKRRNHFQKEVRGLKKEVLEKDEELVHNIDDILKGDLNPNNSEIDNISDFYIRDSILYIDDDDLLSKNIKVSGYFDMITAIHAKEFFHLLNDYGKAVFSNHTTQLPDFKSDNSFQLYVGNVNQKYSIILYLGKGESDEKTKNISVSGKYAYHKYGVGIELEGEIRGNKLILNELDKEREINAYIELEMTDDLLIGIWKDKTKTKTYTFEARPFVYK